MTRNYLKKFIRYAKKVYCIEEGLKTLRDGRTNPSYTTGEVILPVLLGFFMRIQSFNELKYKIRTGDFINIISRKMKLPQIDTIRDTLKLLIIKDYIKYIVRSLRRQNVIKYLMKVA